MSLFSEPHSHHILKFLVFEKQEILNFDFKSKSAFKTKYEIKADPVDTSSLVGFGQKQFMVFDKDDNLMMVIGSPGGSRIINYVAKTLLGVLEWNMDIQNAISMPHYVNRNGNTDLEKSTDAISLKEGLEAKGHKVSVRDLNSGLHGIVRTKEGLEGGADPRRVGKALGK